MTDDVTTPNGEDEWSAPTGEYDRPGAERATSALAAALMPNDDVDPVVDPVFGLTPGELRMVDAFFYEVAIDAANDPRPPTAVELEAIDDLRVRAERLKTMTPAELEAERDRLRRVL